MTITELTKRWFDKALEIGAGRNVHYSNRDDPLISFVRQASLMHALPSEAAYADVALKISRLEEMHEQGAATEEDWDYLVDTCIDIMNYLAYYLTLTERERKDV